LALENELTMKILKPAYFFSTAIGELFFPFVVLIPASVGLYERGADHGLQLTKVEMTANG
jgi:hypothetical protein